MTKMNRFFQEGRIHGGSLGKGFKILKGVMNLRVSFSYYLWAYITLHVCLVLAFQDYFISKDCSMFFLK